MGNAPGWDGRTERRRPPGSEGQLGPEYHYDRWDGVERRQSEHDLRLNKIDNRLSGIEKTQDEHGEMLRGFGEALNPIVSVLRDLQDWAKVFGAMARGFLHIGRLLLSPVGSKLVMLLLLLIYYIRHTELPTWFETVAKVLVL